MKWLWILALTALLASCASVPCPDNERDGGIGGTGQCSEDIAGTRVT